MPTPIIESIAAEMQTTIAAITAGATYTNTIAGCDRPTPQGIKTQDKRVLLIQDNGARSENSAHPRKEMIYRFLVVATAIESEASSTVIDTRLNTLAADIERALLVDQTRNGKAYRTVVTDIDFDVLENFKGGNVLLRIEVYARHAWNNPNTL